VQVTVCRPRHCTDEDKKHAYEVRQLLARAGAVVIGDGIGVMAAAGVRAENGVRPHDTAEDACPDLSVMIVTNLDESPQRRHRLVRRRRDTFRGKAHQL
jgi:hypothetical protein